MSGGGVCGSSCHPVGIGKTTRNAGSLNELTTKNNGILWNTRI
jgi:hypothetical protein